MNKYDYIPNELHETDEPYAKVTLRDYTVIGSEEQPREYSYKIIHVRGLYRPDWGIVQLVGHEGEYGITPTDFLCYEQFNAPEPVPTEA